MRLLKLVLIAAAFTASATTHAATVKVLTAGAFKQVVLALAPAYEARTGNKVDVQNDTAGALIKRVEGGETFDVLVLTPAALNKFAQENRVTGEIRKLAQVAIGVAVKKGAPVPKIDTVEAFKAAVLAARRVAYIDPASGGSSGLYLEQLFARLGIADAVKAKAVLVQGGLVAAKLESGEADLAIHQISEILPVQRAQLVGPLPAAIQNYTTYAAAVSSASKVPAQANEFLSEFAGEDAGRILQLKGMMPAR